MLVDFKHKIAPSAIRDIYTLNPSSYTSEIGKNIINVYYKFLDKAHHMLGKAT